MRSALSFTVLAAALAASLLSTPRLAAQQSPLRPVVAPSDNGQTDAASLRRLVGDEAVHRDRVARLTRLRALAEQTGRRDRLDDLDRLDRVENQRFETRTQLTRRRMGPTAQHQADEVLRKGGVIRLRREATQNGRTGVQRAPVRTATPTDSAPVRRPAASAVRSRRLGGSSTGGSSSSGGRSPR
jgi:hypothetical protein